MAELHAGSGSIEVVLGIIIEELNRTSEFNVSAFIVLPIVALGSKGIMVKRKSWVDQLRTAA
jgi:hypothetical protein